jgi:hypothetical protein
MGFATQNYRPKKKERRWKIHPVWRGIGCALILLILIMSWYASSLLLQTNLLSALPWDLTKPITIRYTSISEIDRVIAAINQFTIDKDLVIGQFVFTIILMVIGFGLLSVVYAILYGIVGPPRYGPLDVPPSSGRR